MLIEVSLVFFVVLLIGFTITNIDSSPAKIITIDNLKVQIRDTEKFEIEALSFPKKQPFPTKHFEVKPFAVVGIIGCGKTTFVTTHYANRAKQIWQDDIDFFIVEDLWGTIESVKVSKKQVHFILIDDSGPLFDCRNPMGNMTATEMYWEIRHELKRYSKQSGGNAGGLVILAIVIQDYMGLDKRIRDALGFTVFKTYDKAIKKEKLIPDEKLQKLLKKLKYKSAVACDWKYRKFAVGVDAEEKYTLFYCDPDQYPYIPFKIVEGEDIFEKQRDTLVRFLVDNISLKAPRDYIEGKLYFEIDKLKKSDERCRISKEHFSEIIKRAKTIRIDEKKNVKNITNERKNESVLILHDSFKKGFREIAKLKRISISTAHDQYVKEKKMHENCLRALEHEELEVNAI